MSYYITEPNGEVIVLASLTSANASAYPNKIAIDPATGDVKQSSGATWYRSPLHERPYFTPSSYDSTLTMDGTAQSVALVGGARKLHVANLGATTEAIRVAFGTSAANAEANLTISTGAATTGFYISAAADNAANSAVILGIPALATHYAVANAVAADTQTVAVTQGI